MKSELTTRQCRPCSAGTLPLQSEAVAKLQQQLSDGWKVINAHHLEREYSFRNFKEALDFTNRVGAIAEQEDHHPDILLAWGKVRLDI